MDRRQIAFGLIASAWGRTAMADERQEPRLVTRSVRTLDDPTWTGRSKAAEDLTPQFSFLLRGKTHVGNPDDSEDLKIEEVRHAPDILSFPARDPSRPTAREVVGHEQALASYYREMIRQAGRRPRPGDVGYWLRLDFVSTTINQEIGFPWWDRVSDADPFVNWLRTASNDQDFFDADEGWLFRAMRKADRFHFQHSDLEAGTEFANLSVNGAAFLARLEGAETEIRSVVAELRSRLDVDPWS